jgi:hypothetical protein
MSNYSLALECISGKGTDAYNHLIYINDRGNGSYSVIFPKIIEDREFNTATLFINSKEMTFINAVKISPKGDELTFFFTYTAKVNSGFSAKVLIVWVNKGNNISVQCPVIADKELI